MLAAAWRKRSGAGFAALHHLRREHPTGEERRESGQLQREIDALDIARRGDAISDFEVPQNALDVRNRLQ